MSSNEAQIKEDEETQATDKETKPDDEQEPEAPTDEPKRVGPRVFDRKISSTSMLQEGQEHEVWAPGRRKSVTRASFIGHNSLEMRRKSLLQRVNSICVGPPGEEGRIDRKQGKSRVPNKETLELRRMQWSLIEEKNDEGGQMSTVSSSVSGSFLTKTPSIIEEEEEEEEEDSGPESVFLSTSDSFHRPPLLSKTSSVSYTMYSIQEEESDSESKTVIGNTITEEEEQQTEEEGENQMEEGENQMEEGENQMEEGENQMEEGENQMEAGEEGENQEKEGEELAGEERKEIAEEDRKFECTVLQVHVPKEDKSESITYVPHPISKRPLQMLVIPAASKRRSDKFVTKLDNSQSPLGRPSNASVGSDLQALETEI